MVARYGMDAKLGNVSYDSDRPSFLGDRPPPYLERSDSEATAEGIDTAVRKILHEVSEEALATLTDNRDILDRAAGRLLEAETLNETALRELAKGLRHPVATAMKETVNESLHAPELPGPTLNRVCVTA